MKKKFYYAGMLAAGLLTFASCNNDEDPIVGGEQNPTTEEVGQVIRIAVANTGDGLQTRAGRPLTSADAAQDIDHVRIVLLQNAGTEENPDYSVVLVKDIDNWMSVSQDYSDDGQGKEYTWRLSSEESENLYASTSYLAYAIGWSEGSEYDFTINSETAGTPTTGYPLDWTATATDLQNKDMNFVNATAQTALKNGEEVFAGSLSLATNADSEFGTSDNAENVLTLHRQVTGTIGYFENIPTYPVGKKADVMDATNGYAAYVSTLKLQLVVSAKNDNLILSSFNTAFRETGENVQYVVNANNSAENGNPGEAGTKDGFFATSNTEFNTGTNVNGLPTATDEDGYVVYEISLGDWFVDGDIAVDGYLTAEDAEGDSWVTPTGISDAVAYQRGTVFAGEFLIPFAKVANHATMQLQLVAGDNGLSSNDGTEIIGANDIVRVWNINLPSDDEQLMTDKQEKHVYTLNTETGEPEKWHGSDYLYEEKADSYSLVRNHLYTIGTISEDENEPEDLSKGQTLMLRVNDNWELIHRMEVE